MLVQKIIERDTTKDKRHTTRKSEREVDNIIIRGTVRENLRGVGLALNLVIFSYNLGLGSFTVEKITRGGLSQ